MTTITVNGTEIGWGSATVVDSDGNQTETFIDSGFGAPDFITVDGVDYTNSAEASFGDPYTNITIEIEGDDQEYLYLPHDGGLVIEAKGDFNQYLVDFGIDPLQENTPIGPFKVEFISQDPGGKTYQAISGLPSLKTNIWTQINQKRMYFATPVMPKGDYTLRFTWRLIYTFNFEKTVRVIHRLRNDKELSMKKSFPQYWNAGHRSDNIIPGGEYIAGQTENDLSVIIRSISENFDNIYSSDYTVTTQNYNWQDSVLHVESTLGFPESGTINIIDGQVLSYTGKTSTSFTGVTGSINYISKNSRAFLTNVEQLKMDDYYRLRNNQLYFPRNSVKRDDFLSAVNIVEFNDRHSEQVIFQYLYKLFQRFNYTKTATINGTTISSPTEGAWNCSHAQRVCKISDKFYFISGETISADGGLILDGIGCTYWNAADFANDSYEIEILPWIVEIDSRGIFQITFESSIFSVQSGYIDKDFIDFNIFIDGDEFDNNTQNNLNLDTFVAAGVIEKINFKRKCEDDFGTYWTQLARPSSDKLVLSHEYTE